MLSVILLCLVLQIVLHRMSLCQGLKEILAIRGTVSCLIITCLKGIYTWLTGSVIIVKSMLIKVCPHPTKRTMILMKHHER